MTTEAELAESSDRDASTTDPPPAPPDDAVAPAAPDRSTISPEHSAATTSRVIAGLLASAGVRHAFTVPGESFVGLLDGITEAGIRVVAARHEGGAGFMAEAAAQLTGVPTVALGTRAVGAANLALAIYTAQQDSTPMVVMIGQPRREAAGREAFQEADVVRSIGRLAKWAAQADDAAGAVGATAEGLRRMSSGRPGPVLIAIPEDVLDEPADPPQAVPSRGSLVAPDRSDVRRVLKLLAASRRGVIVAGAGVLRASATTRLVRLAEALEVPVVSTWRRPDVFPNEHRLYLGTTGYGAVPTVRQRLLEADAMLVLGSRLSEVATFQHAFPAESTAWVHVDIEPRADVPGRPAAVSTLATDVGRFLDSAWSDLRAAVLDAENRGIRKAANAADREAYERASVVDATPWDGPGIHPGRIVTTLQRVLRGDAILTTDAGNFSGWAARGYRFRRPGTFLGPTSGAMGYGLPAAIGASLARPGRTVVALCGDGGFAMTMNELETAVREGATVVTVVFDNRRYGTIRMHQEREGRAPIATDLGAVDFAALARACGADGVTVESDDGFEPALRSALAAGRPAVIHAVLDPAWVSVDEVPGGSTGRTEPTAAVAQPPVAEDPT